jgi:coenzyme F420 hydrogenase subunit beta
MRMNPLARKDFEDPISLAVGVFCNWALDHRRLTAYLSERMDIAAIRGMEIPPPPAEVLVVKTGSGKKQFPLKDIRKLIPHTCFICTDMTAEWTDVSVGMYEGQPGWNTLLIRTRTGAELVDKAMADEWLVVGEFPEADQKALADAALAKKKRSFRNADRQGYLKQDDEERRPALRVPSEVLTRFLS